MEGKHTVYLDSRSTVKVTAVDEVINFDESLVSLAVGDMCLNISGTGLSVQSLSLENGEIAVTGDIEAVVYFDPGAKKKRGRFFSR